MFQQHDLGRWHNDRLVFERVFENVSYGSEHCFQWFQGDLIVKTEMGHEYGPFTIRIKFNTDYYSGLSAPDSYLLSHRDQWQQFEDSHIEKDWRLCLFVFLESSIDFSSTESLLQFIERLSNFLVDASIYQNDVKIMGKNKAKWPGRERLHGYAGIMEVLNQNQTSIFGMCPCGNGKSFFDCYHGRDLKKNFLAIANQQFVELRWNL